MGRMYTVVLADSHPDVFKTDFAAKPAHISRFGAQALHEAALPTPRYLQRRNLAHFREDLDLFQDQLEILLQLGTVFVPIRHL